MLHNFFLKNKFFSFKMLIYVIPNTVRYIMDKNALRLFFSRIPQAATPVLECKIVPKPEFKKLRVPISFRERRKLLREEKKIISRATRESCIEEVTVNGAYFRRSVRSNILDFGKQDNKAKCLSLWRNARSRAKRLNLPFMLALSHIEIPNYCPILGIELDNGSKQNASSIDRIDSRKGYIPSNIWVISFLANTMKHNATPTELIKFSEGILELFKPV